MGDPRTLNRTRSWMGAALLGGAACAAVALAGSRGAAAAPPPAPGAPDGPRRAADLLGRLPLAFEANQGQTDRHVRFQARGAGFGLFLTERDAVMALPVGPRKTKQGRTRGMSALVRMHLAGGRAHPVVEGVDRQPGVSHYLYGGDPRGWTTGVTRYGKIRYRGVYPGVDVLYYGNNRQLEYDFQVAPGADPGKIRLQFQGAETLALTPGGDLELSVAGSRLRQHRPVAYQVIDGQRVPVPCEYRLGFGTTKDTKDTKRTGVQAFRHSGVQGGTLASPIHHSPLTTHHSPLVRLAVGAYDKNKPLTIDPVLSYSSLVGGSSDDYGMAVAVDANSNAYVTGYTASFARTQDDSPPGIISTPRYPVIPAMEAFPTVNQIQRDPDALAFLEDLDLDASTAAVVFMMTDYDAFVFKIDPTGTQLVYSTYLGGRAFDTLDGSGNPLRVPGDDYGLAIAVDPAGSAYVTGMTRSVSFPTERPIQATNGNGDGTGDAFVAKLNAAGNRLVYSTYFGGSGYDVGRGIAVDPTGNCVVTGITTSDNLPTFRAYQPKRAGGRDQFVVNINALGSAYNYSTYLGGTADEGGYAPDHGATPYITTIPSVTILATGDVFPYTELDTGSLRLGPDYGAAVAVDPKGNAYVVGTTASADFKTTATAFQRGHRGGEEAFVCRIDPLGQIDPTTEGFSTFLGGTGDDGARGVAVDAAGNVYITGYTTSADFPVLAGFQTTNAGGRDAFLAKLVPAGSSMIFGSYLGGSGEEVAYAVAVDFAGNAFVTGYTRSSDFPILNPLQGNLRADAVAQDVFVTKVKAAGNTLEYSTYLGGVQADYGTGVAVNPVGTAFLSGLTYELFSAGFSGVSTFPTTFYSVQRFMKYPTIGGFPSTNYGRRLSGTITYPLVDAFVSRIANPPTEPSNLKVTGVAQREIALAWQDNSNNETEFQIERKATGGDFELVGSVGPDHVTFVDTGLTPATTYTYRVRAANLEGTSAYTNPATSTTLPDPPSAPSNLVVTSVDRTRLRLDWRDNSTNESEFRIERKTGSLQFREIATVPNDTTAFTDTGLESNTTYTYRVRALNLGGSSGYSNSADGATLPEPPSLAPTSLQATTVSSRRIDLTWSDTNSNESGFRIERKVVGGTFEVVRVLVGKDITSYSDAGLVQQTEYVYRVRAFNVSGDGPYSNEATATTLPDPPVQPSDLTATSNGAGGVDLKWKDNSSDETDFRIERSIDGVNFTEIAKVGKDTTAYTDTSAVAGSTNYYRVRAANGLSLSEYSNVAAQDNRPSPATDLKAVAVSATEIDLTWIDNSVNETGFKIERSTDGTNFTQIDQVGPNTSSYADKGRKPGTRYFYRVRSSNAQGDSPVSNVADATTLPNPPPAPTNLRGQFTSGTVIHLTWDDNASDETAYIVERSTDGSNFAEIARLDPNVTAYDDSGRDSAQTYFYRVKARNLGGDSAYSNIVRITFPPAAPSDLVATAVDNTQIRLTWTDNSDTETGFEVERKEDGGEFERIATLPRNSTSYLDAELKGGRTYTYRVRAFNAGGNSEYSNEDSAATALALKSFKIQPTRVTAGRSATGTLTLGGPAPAGGVSVRVAGFNPGIASAPKSVTIPEGKSSARFTITTRRGKSGTATFIATYGGQSKQAKLIVTR